MTRTLRIKMILWSLQLIFKFFCYLCQNLCLWLLGLQPGHAKIFHFTPSISPKDNVDHTSQPRNAQKRRRGRPARRTPRHKFMKWLRRHLLPGVAHVAWLCVRHAILAAWFPRLHNCMLRASRACSGLNSVSPQTPPQPVSRCARCVLHMEKTELPELSQQELNSRVLSSLQAWCSALDIPASRLQQCKSAIQTAKPDIAVRRPDPEAFDVILTLAACVLYLVQSKASAWEHIQSLNVVLEAYAAWIFRPGLRTKRSTSLTTDFVFFVCGSLKLVLITDWQAHGGRRKQKRVVSRCLGLDPVLFQGFLDPQTWNAESHRALTCFISLQVFAVLCEKHMQAVLYQLSSPYINYLGSTKFDVKRFGCSGSSPAMRSYQHIMEHRSACNKASSTTRCTLKCRLFKNVRVSDHMFWVLAQGPETYIRCMEEAGIACWRPHGNSRSVGSQYVQKARRSQASRVNRARPKQRLPHPSPTAAHETGFNQWHRSGGRLESRHRAREHDLPLRNQLVALGKLGYSVGYGLALQYMLLSGSGFGPVDLACPIFSALLARYIADARYIDWDSLHQRMGSLHTPSLACAASRGVALAKLVRKMPRTAAKVRATARVSQHLATFGLAPLRRVCVSWPRTLPLWTFGKIVSHMTHQARSHANVWAQWRATLFHPVRSKSRTFADKWGFISMAKGFGKFHASSNLVKLKPCLHDCRQMRRIKLHWRIPVVQSKEQALGQACKTVRWLAKTMQCSPPLDLCHKLVHSSSVQLHASELYGQYQELLPFPRSHEVLVQEDKDKNAAWIMPIAVYEKWCFWMFRQDADHWLPVEGMARDFSETYRLMHLELLPPHLKGCAARKRWEGFELPYAYCTLKAKCFGSNADGVQHICDKPGHSCFRRIISWRSHPARRIYKGVGRAILGVINLLSVGFETKSLLTSVGDFRAAASKLTCSSDACLRCGCSKPCLSICVCDAAQMYEELRPNKIREAVGLLIARLRDMMPHAKGIAVAKSRRLHTWAACSEFHNRAFSTVWTWDDILTVLDLALRQPVIRLGKALFRQVIGAPIGGHLSKAIASAVLAVQEFQACSDLVSLKTSRFVPLQATSLCQAVACTRYVDDLAMGSRVLCESCLHSLTTCIYPKPISFDPTSPDDFGVPWLDVWLQGVNGDLVVRADGAEFAWRSSGGKGVPKKFRVKPWLGDTHTDVQELRGLAASKLTRWKSLHLDAEQLCRAVSCELGIWAMSGYPAKTIRQVWCHLPHYPQASQIATKVLHRWISRTDMPHRILPSWFD